MLQVESAAWNDRSDVLTAIADGRLVTWYYPNAVAIDRDLLGLASTSRDAAEFGKVIFYFMSAGIVNGSKKRRPYRSRQRAVLFYFLVFASKVRLPCPTAPCASERSLNGTKDALLTDVIPSQRQTKAVDAGRGYSISQRFSTGE